ncbi:MAG: hypothetical protein FWG34_15115 [Oscillospiraceae bacterium]|nr:hypothetical protein [Oscillospiraceae bacterium]
MRDKAYLAIISGAFLFLLLWCPAMFALEKADAVSFDDNRNYIDPKVYEDVPFADLLNKIEEIKAGLENLYTNYLPAYDFVVRNMRDAGTSMQVDFVDILSPPPPKTKDDPTGAASVGEIVSENAEEEAAQQETRPPLPQFTVTYLGEGPERKFYAIRPYDFLESVMKADEDTLYQTMRHQAEGVNRLIKANSDVDFYVYIGGTMQDQEYFNDVMPDELCTYDMFHEFLDRIEGAAGIDYFKIGTLDDKLKKQWRTDHHWNSVGSYDVYCDVIKMIAKNSPEIGEPVKIIETKQYPNIKMRGSYAALSGYSRFYEDFFVYVYDLPGSPSASLAMKSSEARYDSGRYDDNKNMYEDHYVNYYQIKNRYEYENGTKRNLMVIGDSLTYWSVWLIAANFDRTYVYMPWDGQWIDYNRYIEDNKITDVLLMVHSQAGIFNIYGYSRYEQLQTGN